MKPLLKTRPLLDVRRAMIRMLLWADSVPEYVWAAVHEVLFELLPDAPALLAGSPAAWLTLCVSLALRLALFGVVPWVLRRLRAGRSGS